jgi:hypothetical protein
MILKKCHFIGQNEPFMKKIGHFKKKYRKGGYEFVLIWIKGMYESIFHPSTKFCNTKKKSQAKIVWLFSIRLYR